MPVEVYNVAEYRRSMCGQLQDAEWFDPDNADAQERRAACNDACINDMIEFLNSRSTGVVILDSTNPTYARRLQLVKRVSGIRWYIWYILRPSVQLTHKLFTTDANNESQSDVHRSVERE